MCEETTRRNRVSFWVPIYKYTYVVGNRVRLDFFFSRVLYTASETNFYLQSLLAFLYKYIADAVIHGLLNNKENS